MIKKRIAAALVVIGFTCGALFADTYYGVGWGFASVMAILAVGALREFYHMARLHGWTPFSWFAYLMAPLLYFGTEIWCLQKWHDLPRLRPDLFSTLIGLAVMGTLMLQIFTKRGKNTMGNVASTLLGLVYIWFLPSFLIRIRHLGLSNGWQVDGVEFIVVCVFVAKASDVGGLLVGSKWGQHKLCPELSPKKTWEGTFGGIFFSVVTILTMAYFGTGSAIARLGYARLVILGVILAVSALLGDLVESAFKRDCEVKDAGASVPGFGGILDLVDSLMVSSPAMYYFLIFSGAQAGME